MANLDITYGDLTLTANYLDLERGIMTDTLTRLQARVSQLTEGGFRTDLASGQYAQSYKELSDGIIQAVDGLAGMAEFLRSTATTYQDVDSQLAAGIRG